MIELLILGFFFYIGYQLGVSITTYRLRHIIFKAANDNGIFVEKELLEEAKPLSYKLEVEKFKDTLYLYNTDKQEFICQGKTVEELAELALKNKNIKYAIVNYESHIYSFVDGRIVLKT